MATPESKVKAAVVKILKANNVYYFFPATGGFGRSGVPDIICCLKGKFVGIECKANGNKPTELQLRELHKINKAGGITFVIDEQGIPLIQQLMDVAENWSGLQDSIGGDLE
jgi:Holliday junction resolvase